MTRLFYVSSAFTIAALSIAIVGCADSSTSPSTGPAFSQTDVRVGTGAAAANGKSLTVNYTGWFYDGSKSDLKGLQFDSSVGRTPFTFTLGAGGVIAGWEQGLPGMLAGGVRRLVIPPSLAYGATRYLSIPPNSTLVFDIELLAVQ